MKILKIRFSPKDTRFRLIPKKLNIGYNFNFRFYEYSFMCFRIFLRK